MNSNCVIIHQQIIPEYRIPVFSLIVEQKPNCLILYGQPKGNSSLKNGTIPLKRKFRKKKNTYLFKTNAFFSSIYKEILNNKPRLIITQYSPSNLNVFLLLFLRMFLRFKLVGWYHGWNHSKPFSPNKTFYDRLRHWLLKKADGIILYSDEAKQVLSEYKNPEHIFVANNTLNTNRLESIRRQLEASKLSALKTEIGFESSYNLIYCSRLEAKKNPIEMLRVFNLLYNKLDDVSLHIVGSGPLENAMQKYVDDKKIKNVIFYGSIYNDDVVGKMIYCSDLMILPQWVGLSIVHAFCFGCPVATFHASYHPPEITYLEHDRNGFIFDQVSDSKIISELSSFLRDEAKRNLFRINALETINTKASIDKMSQGITDAINYFTSNFN